MAHIDLNQEWQRLYNLYANKSDEELLELREDFDDLTEVAQHRLREELQKRKLWVDATPLPAKSPPPEDADDNWTSDEIGSGADLRLGGVTVATCNTEEDADLCVYVLGSAKIRAVRLEAGRDRFDLRMPRVNVAPEDEDRARAILSAPFPDKIVQQFKAEPVAGDFEVPTCKRCGSSEILLESTEPTNQWLCDNCGYTWQDALPEEG